MLEQLEKVSAEGAQIESYSGLARQLFPVARMFESLGFQSLARELAYVEKSLQELDPPPDESAALTATQPLEKQKLTLETAGEAELQRAGFPDEADTPTPRDRFRVPKPLGMTVIVLLVVVLCSIFIVWRHTEQQRRRSATPVQSTAEEPTIVVAMPTPTPPLPASSPTPTSKARLAQHVGESRLALREGDLDRAISRVSAAALIDVDATSVIETAGQIVGELLARADAAAAEGQAEQATGLLDRARELSIRFGFPVSVIDDAALRHTRIVKFQRLGPGDLSAIRNSIGKRVLVTLINGNTEEGRIHGIEGDSLKLDQSTAVGGQGRGGQLLYVEPIPLDVVAEIKVFEDQ